MSFNLNISGLYIKKKLSYNQMLQKIFRSIAVFLFIALIMSPIYFKHIRSYVSTINLETYDASNITENFFDNEETNKYKCTAQSSISIAPEDNTLQVLHFSSPKCHACLDELYDWNRLPTELYKIISSSNALYQNNYKVEIVNILNKDLINDPDTKSFVQTMMNFSPQKKYSNLFDKIAEAKISTCVVAVEESEITNMNIHVFPYSLIVQNGKIIYTHVGQINDEEMDKMVSIINKNITQ
jgi:hypothetical protein